MLRFRQTLPFLGLLFGGALFVGLPPPARADFEVVLQDVNSQGNVVAQAYQTSSGSSLNFSTGVGAYNIVGVFAFQNAQIGGTAAQVETSALTVTMGGTTTDTLRIMVSATGFNFPHPGQVILTSHIGGSATTGSTITFQSFADNNNNLFGVTNAYASAVNPGISSFNGGITVNGSSGAVTTGLQTAPDGDFSKAPDANLVYNSSIPFSLVNVTTFAGLTENESVSTNGSTTVHTPAPSGLALASCGLAVLGIGGYVRRRRTLANV
jgi:hypothetical protein